jgi:23S rRNA (cytosine1962-C5)-methyltransferase
MNLFLTNGWEDYELLDSGNGKRLERFGKYIVLKPDPQAIWKPKLSQAEWDRADAVYLEDKKEWKNSKVPNKWELKYKNIKFFAKLTSFKHTGVFPEQILNWEFIEKKLKNLNYQPNVLNLFGYTGIASLVCAANGAKVTHVDGSKPSISWARENQALSGLQEKPIRWLLDDAIEFTKREVRRGNKYDAIIMDPPVFGHGPNGETWDFNKSFPILLENCQKILADNPLFIIVNAYAITASSVMLKNMLEDFLNIPTDKIEYGEIGVKQRNSTRVLSTGLLARS